MANRHDDAFDRAAVADDDRGLAAPDAITDELVVVSNRQPYRHEYGDGDSVVVDQPTGGLTAGLDAAMRRLDGTWIAWGDGEADDAVTDHDGCVLVPPDDRDRYTLKRIWLSDRDVDRYYYGYSNQVLWPVCHAALTRIHCPPGAWDAYQQVNDAFADAAAEHIDGDAVVWLQDYHLALAPTRIRSAADGQPFLMHFWHIPWPDVESFRTCPHGPDLLEGLLGNDLLGFHLGRYRTNFLRTVDACLPESHVDWAAGRVYHRGTVTTVRALPMGVPADRIQHDAATARSRGTVDQLLDRWDVDPATALAVGVDRLDYSKGIPERLDAIEHLLDIRPRWRGSLTYVQVASESRSRIPAYRDLQATVEGRVAAINDRFGTDHWQPVVYTTDHLSDRELDGLYHRADAALVSPLRDGLNLVAQEYVAAQLDEDGVLVLSDQAGIHDLLGEPAVSVSPPDVEGFATGIERALTMAPAERRRRMRALRHHVLGNDLDDWMSHVFDVASSLYHGSNGGFDHASA
ncbi:trehalose-6-phosphate synthase [Halobacteriales archaeon Cl-PHB]